MESFNRKANSYHKTSMYKFLKTISEGMGAMGEGLTKQHDEDLMSKKKSQK